MDDSEDDDILLLWLVKRRKFRKNRRCWVHPLNRMHSDHGAYTIMKQELEQDPEKFLAYYRMTQPTFHKLLQLVGPTISKQDTNFRLSVSAEERLLITLRHLATGASFKALHFHFLRGETTIGKIVAETAEQVWEVLGQRYMPIPTTEMWKEIADRYLELWNLPNCLGSVDGKHIRVKCPPKSGSAYYNYKGFYSIVLMAVADADGKFISIDVGDYGRNSDGGVFRNSAIGMALRAGRLQIPDPCKLPNDSNGFLFPYYFVGDAAFPLSKNLMRPYPQRNLTNQKRIYNYRLSRGRRSIECAFGMMASKFRLFESPISCSIEKTDILVKFACLMHNFVKMHEGVHTEPSVELDLQNTPPISNLPPCSRRGTSEAMRQMDYLCQYFAEVLPLPWQNNVCI